MFESFYSMLVTIQLFDIKLVSVTTIDLYNINRNVKVCYTSTSRFTFRVKNILHHCHHLISLTIFCINVKSSAEYDKNVPLLTDIALTQRKPRLPRGNNRKNRILLFYLKASSLKMYNFWCGKVFNYVRFQVRCRKCENKPVSANLKHADNFLNRLGWRFHSRLGNEEITV